MTNPIKLKYSEVMSQELFKAFQSLSQVKVTTNIGFRIVKMAKALEKARTKINEEFQVECVKPCQGKDAEGKDCIAEDKMEEFQKLQLAFTAKEIEIDRPKFTLAELDGLKFSAAELNGMMPIIEENALVDVSDKVIPLHPKK